MYIYRILNNNVVVVKGENGREKILMGNGIAFHKKPGDFIPEDSVDKVFTLTTSELSARLQELLADIPMECMEVSDEIIAHAKIALGMKLNGSIYISLTDHLHTAIERARAGIHVKNVLLWDIKRFFADEFSIGLKALEMIENRFHIRLPEDEAGFIALHIVNAQLDETVDNMYGVTKLMQEITSIIKYHFHMSLDENTAAFNRFITHLKFFAQRLVNKKSYRDENDNDLFEVIKQKYPEAYCCVERIAGHIEETYHYAVFDEEKFYLTIHVARVISDSERAV